MKRIGVVDIGSNTANLAVFAVDDGGAITTVAERDQPLQLLRRLGPDGHLPALTLTATVQLLRDFIQHARSLGAESVELISTSAVRDAPNANELVARVQSELGVTLQVLDGAAEARMAVTGVVNTLPLTDGFVIDLGGGSLQITEVVGRRATRVSSLPLGALRLTDQFVRSDPADGPTVNALRQHILRALESVPWVSGAHAPLVGVGGTVRTLAKMARRAANWPIGHNHGFRMTADEIESAWELVSRTDATRRRDIPGLPTQRVDLIVAGAAVVRQIMRVGRFEGLEVCSAGVREGAALAHLFGPDPLIDDIREAGLRGRFTGPADAIARAAAARAGAVTLFDTLAVPLGLNPTARDAFLSAAHLRAQWESRPPPGGALLALLERPIQGFNQQELLAVAELVSPVPRVPVDLGLRVRLSVLLDLAAAGRPMQVRVEPDTVVIRTEARISSESVARFQRTFGRTLAIEA